MVFCFVCLGVAALEPKFGGTKTDSKNTHTTKTKTKTKTHTQQKQTNNNNQHRSPRFSPSLPHGRPSSGTCPARPVAFPFPLTLAITFTITFTFMITMLFSCFLFDIYIYIYSVVVCVACFSATIMLRHRSSPKPRAHTLCHNPGEETLKTPRGSA